MATLFTDPKITIKDIANATGYSVTTVHRAIFNKDGVRPEVAAKIREQAKKMNYTSNAAASALKRKELNIAVVFPNPEVYGRCYFSYMLQGWKDCYQKEFQGFNISVHEYLFDCSVEDDEKQQLAILAQILKDWDGKLDGLLLTPLSDSAELSMMVERFCLTGTAVVLADGDLPNSNRLACVSLPGESIGRLAGELICHYVHAKSGTILTAAGNSNCLGHRNNMNGFEQYVTSHCPNLKIVWIPYNKDIPAFTRDFESHLRDCEDIVAAYSVRGQGSVPMCNAVIHTQKKQDICIVASDLFPETARLMEAGNIDAIIYKKPYEQSYRAFDILANYLIRNVTPSEDLEFIPISLILHSNLQYYKAHI